MPSSFSVLFVVPDIRPDIHVHLGTVFEGVGYLSTFLRQNGFDVSVFAPKSQKEAESLEKIVRTANPDLIGMSCVTSMYKYIREWTTRIKAIVPHIPIICGGIHPTIAPDEVIAHPAIDLICRGEGEQTIVEVCQSLSTGTTLQSVRGIWFKQDGGIVRNPCRPLSDFDGFPFPDLDLFHIENTFYYRNKMAVIKLSRGCPYSCTYCCNHAIRSVYDNPSRYVRFRSPQDAVVFVQEYLRRYPHIDTIAFLDDILFLIPSWFEEFAALYRKNIGLPFACRGRANLFNERIAGMLRQTNCYEITFGVEAGNDMLRNHVLNRKMSKEQIIGAFRLANAYGITTRANNMIGLPYETVDTIFETVRLNAMLSYKISINSVFFPFKGSKLYELCRREGFLEDREAGDSPFSEESLLNLPTISRQQILYFKLWFDVLVWLCKHFPMVYKLLERKHHHKSFPYGMFIRSFRIWRQMEKLGYRMKIMIGYRVKRYTPS